MQNELEELAKWHEERARLDWKPDRAAFHTAAAATIRAAMGEIASLNELVRELLPEKTESNLADAATAFADELAAHKSAALNQKGPQDAG